MGQYPSTTIDALVEGNRNVIIKCDCEGDERFVFSENCGSLSSVYKIQLEYHDTAKQVSDVLRKRGFRVKKIAAHRGVKYKEVGYLYAYR